MNGSNHQKVNFVSVIPFNELGEKMYCLVNYANMSRFEQIYLLYSL